ncbi:GNAT family N-acetyltransferase [Neiella marina]|uniref:GNAT family N-acetyltransferase n=1 Tax=Neiella holothuriorum TaxID=2870530 RepID=A0ABS7EKD6_9GAMM|nr:GNAT family N-acetyltransferase [Neiella holothuriorum]
MQITVNDLSDGEIAKLLQAHLQAMHQYSPADSIHALDTTKLSDPAITFWGASVNGELAGCGALKALPNNEGEVKSMKTDDRFLRQGIAHQLLSVIIDEAKRRGYCRLNLETGTHAAFEPAVAMYEKHGFVASEPFGDYQADPFSRFYSKALL